MVAAGENYWKINSQKISSACLQGDLLKRAIFPKLPEDACLSTHLRKLQCSIYRSNDGPWSWYNKVQNELGEPSGPVSIYDPALFMRQKENRLTAELRNQVDDILFCDAPAFLVIINGSINQNFITAEAS